MKRMRQIESEQQNGRFKLDTSRIPCMSRHQTKIDHSRVWHWKDKQCRNSMAFGFLAQVLILLRLLSSQSLLVPAGGCPQMACKKTTHQDSFLKEQTNKQNNPLKQKPICEFADTNLFSNHRKTYAHTTQHLSSSGQMSSQFCRVILPQTTHTPLWTSYSKGRGLVGGPNSYFCFSN